MIDPTISGRMIMFCRWVFTTSGFSFTYKGNGHNQFISKNLLLASLNIIIILVNIYVMDINTSVTFFALLSFFSSAIGFLLSDIVIFANRVHIAL